MPLTLYRTYLAVAAIVLTLNACGYGNLTKKNVTLGDQKDVFLYIPTGSNFDTVMNRLKTEKVLEDYESFEKAAKSREYPDKIKPGRYQLQEGMTNRELINMLKSGRQVPVKVSFHYARNIPLMSGKVSKKIEADSTAILDYLSDSQMLETKYGFNAATIPAMFIPNTYEFYWNTNAEQFVDRMHKEYQKFWNEKRTAKAEKLKLTPLQVSILASIVQAEQSKFEDEWKRIAGVYLNRLRDGWNLESDPTVIFACGDFTIRRVLYRHLEVESPYNTYRNPGLPPGPILIPEPGAIDAVLDAEEHSYMFMCAKEDLSGRHNFARTNAEHENNARKYQRALNAAGIR